MKSIVKILALVLAVCMLASIALVACGEKEDNTTTTTEAPAPATTTLAPPPAPVGDDDDDDDDDDDPSALFEGVEADTLVTGEEAETYHYGHKTATVVAIVNPGLANWGDGANEQVYDGADGLYNKEDEEGNPITATKIGGSGSNPQLFFELSEAVKLTGYGLVSGWDSVTYQSRHPNQWIVYGIDAESLDDIDLDANWKSYALLDVVADAGFTSENLEDSAEYVYTVNADKAYKYYAIDFWGSITGAFDGFQMNEIYFYYE